MRGIKERDSQYKIHRLVNQESNSHLSAINRQSAKIHSIERLSPGTKKK